MKINFSVSHLAWEKEKNKELLIIFKKYKVKQIDIVLSKYFKNLDELTFEKLSKIKNFWIKNSISIYGMQSILYGYEKFNIFDSVQSRKKLYELFKKINFAAKILGVKKITFGCPQNRKLKKNSNQSTAIYFFRKISKILNKNIDLCIEPIPQIYGNNFLVNTSEACDFVRKINRKNIKVQLDTSCIKINSENLQDIIKPHKSIIGHIHLSEKYLLKLKNNKININLFKALFLSFKKNVFTIEILSKFNSDVKFICDSLKLIKKI